MEAVRSALYAFMLVSLAAGGLSLFAEQSGGTGKYIRYAISLGLVFTLMLPFRELLYLLPQLAKAELPAAASVEEAEGTEDLRSRIADISEELICEGIRRELAAKGASAEVFITVDRRRYTDMELTGIRVEFAAGTGPVEAMVLGQALSQRYLCPCEYVIWEDGNGG